MQHYKANYSRAADGKFIVPLPRKPDAKPLGESRSQAVRRFLFMERSLHAKQQFAEVNTVMKEYVDMGHAEPVPVMDLSKPETKVFYLPIHVVRKESSSTTKVRAVFDASARSTSGVSLNDMFLVGPTVHSPLIDVLLRFRSHRVALTTDVSKMYRAICLIEADKDLHRYVWRSRPDEPLKDYRMTRVTFGISASSFAVNMSLQQNADDFAHEFPMAIQAVHQSFYVDDGLTGADSIPQAIALQKELQDLFSRGQFQLRKWNSSSQEVLSHISPELRQQQVTNALPAAEDYSKTLGLEWNSHSDHFRLTVSDLPSIQHLTKRALVSDVTKVFDALGWFAPTTVKMKILLQRVWECKIEWDDSVPIAIQEVWHKWRSELSMLSSVQIPRCYFPEDFNNISTQLHGFCDASEDAYGAVVYLRITDARNQVHVSLIISKTKVAPIKRLTIPRLELCGAYLLSKLLQHVRNILHIPLHDVFGWTDSTVVLSWMNGNPRRFKTFVGNRISYILDKIPPERWKHVRGVENLADCCSRGIYPSELVQHHLWWNGPPWLRLPSTQWPPQFLSVSEDPDVEMRELCALTVVRHRSPVLPYDQFFSFNHLKRVTAWIFRFVKNCHNKCSRITSHLTVDELDKSERYWISLAQQDYFPDELRELASHGAVSSTSSLISLQPQLDSHGILRVGGRQRNSKMAISRIHPVILPKKHPMTRLIVRTEHVRLLHAGPTLTMSMLSRRFHVVGGRKLVHSIVKDCIICKREIVKPQPQLLGQLPAERITPGPVFDTVGVDYAGPVYVKHGPVRKPVITKAYVCVFVSLTVKAVHLEVVSDLTTEAFIAALRKIEACLNSCPLAPFPAAEDTLEPLTPGHFLIGRPLQSLPDPSSSFQPLSLLRRWDLCQNLVGHFWNRWSHEYLAGLRKHTKWKFSPRNLQVGDIVVLREDGLVPTKWQLARITEVHAGRDGIVRVATIKTSQGTYKRPVTKLALLLPVSD